MSISPISPPIAKCTMSANLYKINTLLRGKTPPCIITLNINEVSDLGELVHTYREVGWVVDHCSDNSTHYLTFRSKYMCADNKQKPLGFMARIKQFFAFL